MGMRSVGWAGVAVALLALSGCVTGGSQTNATINSTYQIARKLDRDLGGTVTRLNETAAALNSRVEESDRQIRELYGLTEENQRRLDGIKAQLDSLTRVIYNQFGLSAQPPRADAMTQPPAGVQPGATVIEHQPTLGPSSDQAPVSPAAPSVSPTLANAVEAYQQAQRKLVSDDYEGAYRDFDDYVQRFPDTEYTPNAQFWKAESLFRLAERKGDPALYEKAIAEYARMRSNFRTSTRVPVAMFNEAVAYDRIGQSTRATELLRELVQNYPTTPAAERARSELQKRGAN